MLSTPDIGFIPPARRQDGPPAISIAATSTAVPPHAIGCEEVKHYLGEVFSIEPARLNAMMAVIDHSQVQRRYCVNPVETIIRRRPLSEISQEYQEHSIRLGRQVAADCLGKAAMTAKNVDLIITVSCTGLMIPSLDAYLINEMGFRQNVRRMPITELGCAAGAAAVARAFDFVRAYPASTALVIAVEIPSLTFQRNNLTQANLISTVLFGDGAAAALVTGRRCSGPRVLDVDSFLFPDSLDAMGFDLKETGLHIVLSKDVPQMIREKIHGLVCGFLARQGLTIDQIGAFVLHPGGQKLLLFIEEELGLHRWQTASSWKVLQEFGNLSSASVLFVLNHWTQNRDLSAREYVLMAAFGPGFSAEMLLLQWE